MTSASQQYRVDNIARSALLCAIVLCANALIWWGANRPQELPVWTKPIAGAAFSAFQYGQSPLEQRYPSAQDIARDLSVVAQSTSTIRSYSSVEYPTLGPLTRELGMQLYQGIWLGRDPVRNLDEIRSGLNQSVNTRPSALVVGNEVLLRGDLPVAALIGFLDDVRRRTDVPVTTAEAWDGWLKHPELVDHVDFITVHLLPYWEGVGIDRAVDHALARYAQVQARFPGVRIVVGEVGWPSRGDRFESAVASPLNQARFLREWVGRADDLGIDYFVMEAIDQPWKVSSEGRAGAYWGLYNADRQAKFSWTEAVQGNPHWPFAFAASALLALPLLWLFARRFADLHLTGLLTYLLLLQGAISLLVALTTVPFAYYLGALDKSMLLLIVPTQLMMIGIVLVLAFEFVETLSLSQWRRHFQPTAGHSSPFVSIHVPCHNEPPDMVIATLQALARLDYADYEVIVVDNNTHDPAVWQPVADAVTALGPRFRFFHLAPWPGFKAGALNYALAKTDARAVLVAVLDSDYLVDPQWLRTTVDHFDEARVAVVQLPQAHRDTQHNLFTRIANFEYEGFFRIGMHHRHERNAIIQHGTMCLIRVRALREVGGWGEWCICEDAELGVRLLQAGYEARYIDVVMGRGLVPPDFKAMASQRFRWAFGAMQILKRHWAALWRAGGLSLGQRFHFLTGWIGWFADALHLLCTLGVLAWTVGMVLAPQWCALPLQFFLFPVLLFGLTRMVLGIISYRVKVDATWFETLGAALTSMALSHTVARAVLRGLWQHDHPFTRTEKRLLKQRQSFAARSEALLLLALVAAMVASAVALELGKPEVMQWLAILAVQSLPYAAAVIMTLVPQAGLRRERLNPHARDTTLPAAEVVVFQDAMGRQP